GNQRAHVTSRCRAPSGLPLAPVMRGYTKLTAIDALPDDCGDRARSLRPRTVVARLPPSHRAFPRRDAYAGALPPGALLTKAPPIGRPDPLGTGRAVSRDGRCGIRSGGPTAGNRRSRTPHR